MNANAIRPAAPVDRGAILAVDAAGLKGPGEARFAAALAGRAAPVTGRFVDAAACPGL